jgi:multicomponent Na+:H+ antiporter subunit E
MSPLEEAGRPAEPDGPGNTLRSAIFRAAGFFGLWLVLTGADLADLAAGAVAAVAATWASLRLMPAEQWNLRPIRIVQYLLHFLRQSIAAGTDVALRALDPRLPIRPGLVAYQAQLAPGTKRNAFLAIMSLLPGTLPCGPAEGDGQAIHCLDVTEPVVEQLSREETLCMQTFGGSGHDG